MKIWKIEFENYDYDEVTAVIVVAATAEDALSFLGDRDKDTNPMWNYSAYPDYADSVNGPRMGVLPQHPATVTEMDVYAAGVLLVQTLDG